MVDRKRDSNAFSSRVFRVASALVACGAGAVFFSACSLFQTGRIFNDAYYDDNFIANIGFDQFVGDETTVPSSAATGKWDFEYRYETGWETNGSYPYITLVDTGNTASTYGSGDGLSSSAEVYRLELVNLVSNGDFETSAGTWLGFNSSTAIYSPAGINGKSVALDLQVGTPTSESYVTYAIDDSQLNLGLSYDLNFKWKASSGSIAPVTTNSTLFSKINSTALSFFPADATSLIGQGGSNFIAASAGSNIMVFRIPTPWSGMIDDVTVKKTGSNMNLRLLLTRQDTEPDLEDFLYIFSVWVCPDGSVGTNTSPYNLNYLGIDMRNTSSSTLSKSVDSTYSYSSSSGWKKISVRVDNGNLQIASSATGAVLELVLNLSSSLPGRVLIAQPELRAYPDGY